MKKKNLWFIMLLAALTVVLLAPVGVFAAGRPDHGMRPDPGDRLTEVIEFTGQVESKDATIPGDWVIDGRTVRVTFQTQFNTNPVTIQVGDYVEVRADQQANGTLLALRIKKVQGPTEVHFTGVINEIADDYWVVDDKTVTITEQTVILGGDPDVGDIADVVANETDDGLVAKRIVVVDANQSVHFPGIIKEMADDVWVITTPAGDKTVAITDDTSIEGDTPDVGDRVKVWANVTADGLVATRILVNDTPSEVHFKGRIQEMNDDSWVVAYQTVAITADTSIEGDDPNVGDIAEVWATPTADGLVATRIVVTSTTRFAIVRGAVESQSDTLWVINGHDVGVNEDTKIVGNPQVGDEVIAVVRVQDDGSLMARSIHKVPTAPPEDRVAFSGFITEIQEPENEGDPTMWVVTSSVKHNGETQTWTVWVSDDTDIVPEGVEVQVGAWVKGYGEPNEDGSVNALGVQVVAAPRVSFAGAIEQQPDSGVVGDWVIQGVTVHVTDDTRVVGDPASWDGYAQGYGTLNPDGSVTAIVIGPMPGH